MPRADVAAEHKGCSPVGPALKNVWALRFLTNGVQVQSLDQLEQVVLVRRIAQANAQPIRFWLTRFRVHNSKFARQVMMDLSFAKHSSIGVCNSASKGRVRQTLACRNARQTKVCRTLFAILRGI